MTEQHEHNNAPQTAHDAVADEVARAQEIENYAKQAGFADIDFLPDDEPVQTATSEGSSGLAVDSAEVAKDLLNTYEALIKNLVHEDFNVSQAQKDNTATALVPMIEKYGGAAAGLFGEYKDEALAALAVGNLTFSTIKQVKALKQQDAITAQAEKPAEPAQAENEPEQVENGNTESD